MARFGRASEPAFKGGLVDECHLFIGPVVIGGGKPALRRDGSAELELVDERRFTDGVVYLRYRKPVEPSTPWVDWTAGSR
jgi:riboflavin biosynthesis pyrimidine reductase